MKELITSILIAVSFIHISAQDLTQGLVINDLSAHEMQDIEKPEYLEAFIEPSFNTTIRRITNAGPGEVIVPMYSTVQAWNADETYMILYNQSTGNHILLDGHTYELIRPLSDVYPSDLEQIFWDFNDPDIFYYPDSQTNEFISYSVSTQNKQTIINLASLSGCNQGIAMGNDIQMMSWDSDVITFRCGNDTSHAYRLSTGKLTTFAIHELSYTAPSVAPSGTRFQHNNSVYNSSGDHTFDLNKNSTEHSCIGILPNGNDAYFAIAFAEGPQGGCLGDIIAHDLTTGECFPVISQSQGYNYPQSGTHISALAHKNTQGGWMAASMIGYDQDGQSLLDQELIIARADKNNIEVCRIGHHRSDEDQFDYWGEPHAVISPTGTRVLFGSDWSGNQDGESIDSYVVELPAYIVVSSNELSTLSNVVISPNPVIDHVQIGIDNISNRETTITIYDINGKEVKSGKTDTNYFDILCSDLTSGTYLFIIDNHDGGVSNGKFVKL